MKAQYDSLLQLELEDLLKVILGHKLINIRSFAKDDLTYDELVNLGLFHFEPQGNLYNIYYIIILLYSILLITTFRKTGRAWIPFHLVLYALDSRKAIKFSSSSAIRFGHLQ